MIIKNILAAVTVAALVALGSAAYATQGFKAKPFEFVGTAAQCAPAPAGSNIVTGAWVTHEGLPDAGQSDHALFLQKNGPTADCSSAGATIDGESGIVLNELGFDYRNDGHCGAGAPRYNVYTAGTYFFFGCVYGIHTPVPGNPGWTRVKFTNADAFPADGVTPWPGFGTAVVTNIDLVFDEGTDQGVGFVYLDNLDINGTLIGKPGNAR